MKSLVILPAPFEWIDIPGKGYSIAKYPITNAQYAKFIKAGGYTTESWWIKRGWQRKQDDGWAEPRFWQDSKWNGAEQPVIGVSWYEAVAFCLWLRDVTSENIMLPTEDQWQYAAQSDDGRIYPWGNEWDSSRCNNHFEMKGICKTTSVTQYEGKNNSPFGVVDMAGNVWDWCLTNHNTRTNHMNSNAKLRVLRGGSWIDFQPFMFQCDYRFSGYPYIRYYFNGFRLSRS